jgi:hypothetical protein
VAHRAALVSALLGRSALASELEQKQRPTPNIQLKVNQRVRGIEPPCAAWEAAVLPLNYTRVAIFDFRFSIADCNLNKS